MAATQIDPLILRPDAATGKALVPEDFYNVLISAINQHAGEIDGFNPSAVGFVTPEQFGAVGDGVTNDLAAFKTMDTTVAALGGLASVRLSAKTYILGRDGANAWSWNITSSNLEVWGIPGRSFLKHPTNMPATSVALARLAGGNTNVRFRNVGFDGNWGNAVAYITQASSDAALGSTINVDSTAGFPSSGTALVNSTAGLQTVTYTNTTATSFGGCSGGTGTLMRGYRVGLQSSAAGLNHQTQAGSDPKNYLLFIGSNCTGITVENCIFQQAYGDFIWAGQFASNIRILHCDANICARHGLTIGTEVDNLLFRGNTFKNVRDSAFHSEPIIAGVHNIRVDHNFLDCWFDVSNVNVAGALYLTGGDSQAGYALEGGGLTNVTVTDNTINGCVFVEYARHIAIRDNTVTLDWATSGKPAIEVFNGSGDIDVDHNYVYSRCTSGGGIEGQASTGVIAVTNNQGVHVVMPPTSVRVSRNKVRAKAGKHGILLVGAGGSLVNFSGTATSVTGTTVVKTGAGWTTDQFAGGFVQIGASFASIQQNTSDTLTLDPPDTSVTSAWQTEIGTYAPTPTGTPTFTIIKPCGMVDVFDNEVDCRDDGNGAGGCGIRVTNISGFQGHRYRIRDNKLKNCTTDGIFVKWFAATTFAHLEIRDNTGHDEQPTPTFTNLLTFSGTVLQPTKWIMRNNVPGEGVTNAVSGLATGRWLVSDGAQQEWEGFGVPSFSAPKGSRYWRQDPADANTLLYVNASGSTTWTAK